MGEAVGQGATWQCKPPPKWLIEQALGQAKAAKKWAMWHYDDGGLRAQNLAMAFLGFVTKIQARCLAYSQLSVV